MTGMPLTDIEKKERTMHEPSRGRRVPIAGESRGIGAYLCPVSDALSVYVTGQVIEVNGGQSMP